MLESLAPLTPSKLGTKEHWDKVYERELKNLTAEDLGECWFGESSGMKLL
jgi:hypothetical protein